MRVTFNENQSDLCLSELLHGCKISHYCWSLFTTDQLEGYPLTHQVLYLTIARAVSLFIFRSHLQYTLCIPTDALFF